MYEPSGPSGIRARRIVLAILVLALVLLVAIMLAGQLVWFWMNMLEFGELFIRPIFFEILAGLILSFIVLFRFDFKNRRSIVWWALRLVLRLIREKGLLEAIPPHYIDFKVFKMPVGKFVAWQVTKVLLGMAFFRHLIFGMTVYGVAQGWDVGLKELWGMFILPFVTPPLDMAYAQQNVIPLIPSLTLIMEPLLAAIGTRFLLLVGLTQFLRIITPTVDELVGERPQLKWRIAVIEGLIALGLFWGMFNLFFPSFIDYNTKVAIGAVGALGLVFLVFAYKDWSNRRESSFMIRRKVTIRVLTVLIIVLLASSTMAVQNSIADARKVEWLGPYTVQQISVNRYLAQLDEIKIIPHNFSLTPIPAELIPAYVEEKKPLLQMIRLWDWQAAFAKLKPEIGLIPYIDFQDSDIIRFNKTLYWSASMKPVMPPTVRPEDRWYASHFHYTHVPNGFLLLDANRGEIVDSERFFKQRRIYYGEGGLLAETWAAYPVGREKSDELGGYFYKGDGGVEIHPPLSWLFDVNFFWAYRDRAMHILRYRDVFDRMQLLFPYFEYEINGKRVDMLPVTDGSETYWLMPLIVRLDASHVPWSAGNPLLRLVGYALINIYSGEIQLIVLGKDFFSELFKKVYQEYITTEVPKWLRHQLRYPEELFEWRVSLFNFYHVIDPATFIVGKEFFEVPKGLDTYYIIAQLAGFESPEFIGLLSLELRGAGGRNLAGYMVVRNEYRSFGEMLFYQVDIDSPIKLLGPSAVLEALEKNPEFAKLKTLLRSPRIGDKIFYHLGDHAVYFIPVYTAGAGGVVTEMGTIAAVGATFTGSYYVGLGDTVEEAFASYLAELAGIEAPPPPSELDIEARRQKLIEYFEERNFTVLKPKEINPHVSFVEANATFSSDAEWEATKDVLSSFIESWGKETKRVLMWAEDSNVSFGFLITVDGVVELHYITISLA